MSREALTLEAFASRVGCHVSTASRFRSGDRMPSREMLGRIMRAYPLDPREVLTAYTTADASAFGTFLRENVFEQGKETARDRSSHRVIEQRVAM